MRGSQPLACARRGDEEVSNVLVKVAEQSTQSGMGSVVRVVVKSVLAAFVSYTCHTHYKP